MNETSTPLTNEQWPESADVVRMERFSERTLRGIANLTREMIFSGDYTDVDGVMQRLDARVKLATMVAFVILVSLCRRPADVAILYVSTVLLAAASRIPPMFFIKRVWFFIPLFSAAIAVPALFVVPGETLVHVVRYGGMSVDITKQGAYCATLFVLRVAASVSFVALTALTTKWARLLHAMRSLGAPAFFVQIVAMTYRYIFALLMNVEEQYLARRSRPPIAPNVRREREWIASRIGATFTRSMLMGEEVYSAMVARGFDGDIRLVDNSRLRIADMFWCVCVTAAYFIVYFRGGFH